MYVPELVRKEGLRRGLRNETIRTYTVCLAKFFRVCRKDPRCITQRDILAYIDWLGEWGKSGSTLNVHFNALRFFYEQVLRKSLTVHLQPPRVRKRLPEFLTQEEVVRLFAAIENEKHKLIIKLLYATGMRVSELVKLKVHDFQFDHNYGWIRDGKGGKDRLFVVAQKLKSELQEWIHLHHLDYESWLFSGLGKHHISSHTIRLIVKRATQKAKILKNVHPHTLRHSFATHLLENGYALTDVQPLLGHSKMETTMIYAPLARPKLLNVKSPLDGLQETLKWKKD